MGDGVIIQPPFQGGEKYILWGQYTTMIQQLNRVLGQMLTANDGQGLAFANPYTPVGVPSEGDIPQWTIGTPSVYAPKSIETITGFGFQVVDTFSDFTTPEVPSFGYTLDTGIPYFFTPVFGNWQIIGTVFP